MNAMKIFTSTCCWIQGTRYKLINEKLGLGQGMYEIPDTRIEASTNNRPVVRKGEHPFGPGHR